MPIWPIVSLMLFEFMVCGSGLRGPTMGAIPLPLG